MDLEQRVGRPNMGGHENDGSQNYTHHPITDTSTTDGANSVYAADIDGDTRIDLLSASILQRQLWPGTKMNWVPT